MRSYLDGYFKSTISDVNKYKFEATQGKISYRKSDSVNIENIDIIPKEFIKEKVEISADKTEIKKAIKNGHSVDGAILVTNLNMQIK